MDHLVLDGLCDAERDWLAPRLRNERLVAGMELFSKGEPPRAVWFLLDATVATYAETSDGRRIGLTFVGPGHVVGATRMLGDCPSPWSATVEQGGSALTLDEPANAIAANAPSLHERLGWSANDDMLRLSQAVVDRAHGTATQRVAAVLEDRFIASDERVIATTHEQLSEWLAVRRATVSVALQELESIKAIRSRRGTIELLDAVRLSDAACCSRA